MPYKDPKDEARRSREYRQARREASGIDAPFAALMKTVKVKGPNHGLQIAVIPDTQIRPGVPLEHLTWCGEYLARKQPDVIIHIGDAADMPSLSMHEGPGHISFEGVRYKKDIDSVRRGMEMLTSPLVKTGGWNPVRLILYGNHEDRITRAIRRDPKLEGLIQLADLEYELLGWKTVPFLQPISINGVAFCHYFPSGVLGRPITAAKSILTKLHMSAYAGHQQGRDIAYSKRADGKDLTAIISGSFYQHHEDYLSPFTNQHWRGMYILHEVRDGSFDEMAVSMDYLRRKFS